MLCLVMYFYVFRAISAMLNKIVFFIQKMGGVYIFYFDVNFTILYHVVIMIQYVCNITTQKRF